MLYLHAVCTHELCAFFSLIIFLLFFFGLVYLILSEALEHITFVNVLVFPILFLNF